MEKDTETPIQYALGQPARRTGLGGLSLKATVIVATGFMFSLLLQMGGHGKFSLYVVVPVTIFLVAVVTIRISGRSVAQYTQMIVQDRRRRASGAHVYVSGPGSRVPGGHRRLPGLLARTEAIEGVESGGLPFVMIVDRPRHEVTVVLDCQMTGQTAMTQHERNTMTAEWSRWLAQLSLTGDVRQVVTVVATRPGTGKLVASEVNSIIDPSAPALAQQILREAAHVIGMARPEIQSHIAITVKVDADTIKGNRFVPYLATRVSTWAATLAWCGILATPMSYEQAAARIHSFYDPACDADFEELALTEQGHGLAWEDTGPSMAVTHPSRYEHDGCTSITWEMRDAPRSTFEDTLLRGLVSPHERVTRKRVAVVYRPFEAGAGAARVEAEHRDAMVAANSAKKITSARAEMRLEYTEAARQAQARGAQLGRTSMFVTATTGDKDQLPRLIHDVEQLAAGASIRLQPMRFQQDSGFQYSCGFGQVPWDKATTSQLLTS